MMTLKTEQASEGMLTETNTQDVPRTAKQLCQQRTRTAWHMRRAGLKFKQIASELGVPPDRARHYVARAEKQFGPCRPQKPASSTPGINWNPFTP